jgi:hypothetical protein
MRLKVGVLVLSGTKVHPCTEESTDVECLEINALGNFNSNKTNGTLDFAEIAPTNDLNETNTTRNSYENIYTAGGLLGGTGIVATTLLIIFRTPKTSKSQMDDGPDLETVTEGNFPDNADLPEVTEGGVLFEPGTGNFKEEGPSAADIDAVFPSIFSTIMGDLRKD